MGLFDKLKAGLSKTREAISAAVGLAPSLDASSAEALEHALLRSDLGAALTAQVMDELRRGNAEDATGRLVQALLKLATAPQAAIAAARPEVVLVLGVNGSGKTTSCGKLAFQGVKAGQKVLLAGADTFRAAAVEQLKIWAERAGAGFMSQGQDADPAAVAFDAVAKARSGGYDRVIIDTAGRLQTKANRMEELSKIRRVCDKAMPGAPHRTLLVLDGTAGQNMISQARLFHAAAPLSGLIVTKLDGTAKAGAVLAVMHELKIPVAMVGVGEAAEDLQPFDAEAFVRAMVQA